MQFIQWLESEEGPHYQKLFPFMSEEEPLDWKKIARYKDEESYVRAKVKGAKKTEDSTEKIVSATPNSFWSMMAEELIKLWNDAIILPPHNFTNGTPRPEFRLALALFRSKEPMENGLKRTRLLAYYQGHPGEKLTPANLSDGVHSIIGGLVIIGGYLTHAWVDKHWRGTIPPNFNLFRTLMEFARTYLGVHGLEPGDDLTSKSYRAAQARHEYRRYLQWKAQNKTE